MSYVDKRDDSVLVLRHDHKPPYVTGCPACDIERLFGPKPEVPSDDN